MADDVNPRRLRREIPPSNAEQRKKRRGALFSRILCGWGSSDATMPPARAKADKDEGRTGSILRPASGPSQEVPGSLSNSRHPNDNLTSGSEIPNYPDHSQRIPSSELGREIMTQQFPQPGSGAHTNPERVSSVYQHDDGMEEAISDNWRRQAMLPLDGGTQRKRIIIGNDNDKLGRLLRPGEEIVKEAIQNESNLQNHPFLTDAGREIMLLDLRAKPQLGPPLDEASERRLLGQQGYVGIPGQDDMVQMMEDPNRKCNRLSYGLFGMEGAHIHDPEAVEKIVKDNYTLYEGGDSILDSPFKGDLAVCQNGSTGAISDTGFVEAVDGDGNVTQISCKWDDEGGICKHHPDIPRLEYFLNSPTGNWEMKQKKTPDTWRFYYRNDSSVSGHFEIIDCTTEKITEADTIYLAENHADKEIHRTFHTLLLASIVKPGAIILIEGFAFGPKLNAKECRLIEPLSTVEITVTGWESNMTIHAEAGRLIKEDGEMRKKRKQSMENGESEKCDKLDKQLGDLWDAIDKIHQERNRLLTELHCNIRKKYPGSQIIIIGGTRHFVGNTSLQEILNKGSYIALEPTHKLSKEDEERLYEEHLNSSLKRRTY